MNRQIERVNIIPNLVRKNGSMTISELCQYFSVSEMTIRRDISFLSKHGELVLNRGEVTPADSPSRNLHDEEQSYNLIRASKAHHNEKTEIGKHAATIVEENDVLFVDDGTTTEQLVRALASDLPVTIVCYSANILDVARRNFTHSQIILLGGMYNQSISVFESTEGLDLLKRTRISKAFISANAIDTKLGVTCSRAFEASVKQTAMQICQQKYLLVDSSKFQKINNRYFAEAHEFDQVITDRGCPKQTVREYADHGAQIVIAGSMMIE